MQTGADFPAKHARGGQFSLKSENYTGSRERCSFVDSLYGSDSFPGASRFTVRLVMLFAIFAGAFIGDTRIVNSVSKPNLFICVARAQYHTFVNKDMAPVVLWHHAELFEVRTGFLALDAPAFQAPAASCWASSCV